MTETTAPRLSAAQRRVLRYVADNPGAYGWSRLCRTYDILTRLGLIELVHPRGAQYRLTAAGAAIDPPDVSA